jgi:hypothetical protein
VNTDRMRRNVHRRLASLPVECAFERAELDRSETDLLREWGEQVMRAVREFHGPTDVHLTLTEPDLETVVLRIEESGRRQPIVTPGEEIRASVVGVDREMA